VSKATKQLTLRAFVYVRISDDKKGQGAGVARQTDDSNVLAARIGADVVEVFDDNDRSATKGAGTRPAYERMIGAVANGECDVVIAYSQERLWRDDIEHPLFMRLARDAGVRVYLVNGGEVDPNDANHMLVSSILNAVNVMEVANTKRRVGRELIERRKAGKYLGGGRAFGHNADRTALNVREARHCTEACERVVKGETLASIVADWRKRGITGTTGRPFGITTLGQLIKQPRLAGLCEVDGNKYTRKANGTEGKSLHPADWPAVVEDVDLWRDAVHVLNMRNGKRTKAARRHVFSGGLMVCSACGTAMYGTHQHRNGRKWETYRCPPSTQREGACGGTCINGVPTEEHVTNEVFTMLDTEAFAKAIKRAIKAQASTDLGNAMAKLERKRARADDIEGMFTDGEIDRAEYKRMRASVRDDIESLERDVASFDGGPPVHLVGDGKRLRKAWAAMTFTEKQTVLALLINRITVVPGHRGKRWSADRLVIDWRYR
jgi:site-specific DNA recombinase